MTDEETIPHREERMRLTIGLSHLVVQRMRSSSMRLRELARAIHSDMDIGEGTVEGFICDVRCWAERAPYSLLPDFPDVDERGKKMLCRIAHVLYGLNVGTREQIIDDLRSAYGFYFAYPPSTLSSGETSFGKNLKRLTRDDKRWVERLVDGVVRGYD